MCDANKNGNIKSGTARMAINPSTNETVVTRTKNNAQNTPTAMYEDIFFLKRLKETEINGSFTAFSSYFV